MLTDDQIDEMGFLLHERINRLATIFYAQMGKRNKPEFNYAKAHHPEEQLVWNMAIYAHDVLMETDLHKEFLN